MMDKGEDVEIGGPFKEHINELKAKRAQAVAALPGVRSFIDGSGAPVRTKLRTPM